MFLTGKHLATVDLFLEIFVNNSCFRDLTQPLFTLLLVFGISCRGQFPDADSFRPPARTTAKNRTVIAGHFTFEMINIQKPFTMTELHFLAYKTRQMTTRSFAKDAILNLSVHGHCHVT